jgi:hypothetical protein
VAWSGLSHGPNERSPFENEGNRQDGISDKKVRCFLRFDQLLDATPDRHNRAGGEESNAANIDQTYASRPNPIGCRLSGSRSDRRSATTRKISLPASAQECAASASIDADEVIAAAIDLAIAISRLARNAISTVSRLSLTFSGFRSLSAVNYLTGHLSTLSRPAGRLILPADCQVPPR